MAKMKGISPPTWTKQLFQQATGITLGYLNQHFSSASENLPVSKLQYKLDLRLFSLLASLEKQVEYLWCYYSSLQLRKHSGIFFPYSGSVI